MNRITERITGVLFIAGLVALYVALAMVLEPVVGHGQDGVVPLLWWWWWF